VRAGHGLVAAGLCACLSAGAADLSGLWATTTSTNPSDFFTLEIVHGDHSVCGRVTSTSEGTDKKDSSFFIGNVSGSRADVQFESMLNQRGVRGTAQITFGNGWLDWKVTQPLTPGAIWPKASLNPQAWERGEQASLSGWCAARWKQIESGSFADIRLQP
jgi:hypothetical protein